jgi:fatty-acyl-CoA synthase
MQDWPLLVHTIIDHAAINHGEAEVVSRTIEGPTHRTNYTEINARSRKLASALKRRGYGFGDVIGTMAWNGYRHLEAWYAIAGLGAVYHTLNPRLFEDQLDYIINHGGDRLIFIDLTFVPLMEKLIAKLPRVRDIVIMTDPGHMPSTSLENAICYESLLAEGDDDFQWPRFDENTACGLCYTSGTTGNPKGVLYSHRSNVLHAMAGNFADVLAIKSTDVVLPVVPMFHANAWALTFAAPMMGAKMVMPGEKLDGESLYRLLREEKVTFTAAVPTVWLILLQYLEKAGGDLPGLERVAIGGAACPPALMEAFEKTYGVRVMHAWGMTEMSPLGTLVSMKAGMEDLDEQALWAIKLKQGRPFYTVEMKIVDDEGREQPRDGKTSGTLVVRGPAVSREYYKGEGGQILDPQGWFDTGDVGTIDPYGFFQITDRSKDVIKSGGEWISSIDLENVAVGHEAVAEAAVIGIAHPKWDERPLLIVVLKPGAKTAKEDILGYLKGRVAKLWMPDDVAFVEEIPHSATGKIDKVTLRRQFEGYVLPTAQAAE